MVRPFRAVSTKSVGPSNSNQARPGPGKQEVVPNYRTVLGASYDDLPISKTVEDDFEDQPALEVEVEESSTEKKANFTKQELYDLCIKEVPDYLRNDLCGSLLEPVTEETTSTSTSTTLASTSTSTAASAAAKPVIDVTPKNAHLIQSGSYKRPVAVRPVEAEPEAVQLEVVTEKSVRQESYVLPANANNNYLGIPLELPVEVKRKSQQEEPKPKDKESETTFKVYRTSAEVVEEPKPNQEVPVQIQAFHPSQPQAQAQAQAQAEEETTVYQPVPGYDEPVERSSLAVSSSAARPPTQAKPDPRQPPPNYLSRIFSFFGGSKSGPGSNNSGSSQALPPRQIRKRVNA